MSSDIVGPYPTHEYQTNLEGDKFYLITLTDLATRFTRVQVLESITSEKIKPIFSEWFKQNGYPKQVITDCGKQYVSTNFRSFLSDLGINSTPTLPYNPRGNSVSERLNQGINNILRICRGKSLDMAIEKIHCFLNSTFHKTLGTSPQLAMNGWTPVDPLKRTVPEVFKNATRRAEKKCLEQQEKGNLCRVPHTFVKGDFVLLRTINPSKTSPRFKGPYEILTVSDSQRQVEFQIGGAKCWNNIHNVIPFRRGRKS